MYRNKKILYTTFAILSFLFCFAFLQTIQLGGERVPLSLTVYGRNLEGIKTHYNNKITRNTPLDIDSSSSKYCSLTIPEYAFVRSFVLALNYNDSLEIHKIELQGNSNKITINAEDIPNYLRYDRFIYNTKTKKFFPTDTITNNPNANIVIRTVDISDLIIDLYIKRLPENKGIMISLVFSILTLIIYYWVSFKNKTLQTIALIIATVIFVTASLYSFVRFNHQNTIKENLTEADIFDIIKPHTPNNLIYNGDFKYGLMFWGYDSDSTTHQLVDTPYGKGVRIIRGDGNGGYWSLRYFGRPIIYHENHTYQIQFKYKVIKGEVIPFNIGFWINKEDIGYGAHRQKIYSTPLDNNWYNAEVNYEFIKGYQNRVCILNSLQDYSDIVIADIFMYDLTRNDTQVDFVDQIKK